MTIRSDQNMNTAEPKNQQENTSEHLFRLTMEKKWSKVVEVYKNDHHARAALLTKSKETALHVAVSSYSEENINSCADAIKKMIDCIPEDEAGKILSMQNDKGNTPLHLAAAVGWENICGLLASKHPHLISIRNVENETPLFMAAHHGNLKAFLCLNEIYKREKEKDKGLLAKPDNDFVARGKDGNTILHSAISGEYFELAYQIICLHPELINSKNVNGESALHVLAKKPNVFESSSHIGPYDSIIYHCASVDKLKKHKYVLSDYQNNSSSERDIKFPENYSTCINIWGRLLLPIYKSFIGFVTKQTCCLTDEENQQNNESQGGKGVGFFPPNYKTCIFLHKFAMKVALIVLGLGISRVRKIQKKKELCSHAIQIMDEMIEHESGYKYYSDGKEPVDHQYSAQVVLEPGELDSGYLVDQKSTEKGTPFLIAAKRGIPEMVEKILSKFPLAIQDLDSDGKNVLLLAAENRQTSVFDSLMKLKLPDYMFHHVDNQGNNILHLAAKLGELQPWRIPGAALQMQWELKWYKHVKSSIPALCFTQDNNEGKTPGEIFSKTHSNLVKEGGDWLTKTSESCSLIAAIIATVAFATSATIPGGLDENTGYPKLKDRPEFDFFAISSVVALCLSVTALVFFLAIITSRCQERDFMTTLPRMLLMGLTSLFGSIAAMLLSFCAGHTFILREKLRLAVLPIYATTSIPVTFFAVAQLPLYFDLLWAACRKVPLRSYKVFYQ